MCFYCSLLQVVTLSLRQVQFTIDGKSEDGNSFKHNCDTAKNSAGSPVTNKNGEVLAIHYYGAGYKKKYVVFIESDTIFLFKKNVRLRKYWFTF
jgi:V8-like Glu-specific endopeptidase